MKTIGLQLKANCLAIANLTKTRKGADQKFWEKSIRHANNFPKINLVNSSRNVPEMLSNVSGCLYNRSKLKEMRNKMDNEFEFCQYGLCENKATTKSWKQPAPIKISIGEIIPNKILINTCYTCDLLIDLKEYGTN
jgi:hypothetical protein